MASERYEIKVTRIAVIHHFVRGSLPGWYWYLKGDGQATGPYPTKAAAIKGAKGLSGKNR